jgi:MerR family transcriptional regulator, thiopeptide resistance regulator
MITIRKLGAMFGLSRTALLYYDRIGLLEPTARSAAGYRMYDEAAVARLRQICTYKNAGLGLAEIAGLMDRGEASDVAIFRQRLAELDRQIAGLRIQQRAILALMRQSGDRDASFAIERDAFVAILRTSGMNEADMRRWHAAFEDNAPEAHHSFLRWLGIPEAEIMEIRQTSEQSSKNLSPGCAAGCNDC